MGLQLDCGRHRLDLSYPRVMGVLNVTPDSFSDGGEYLEPTVAIRRALQMQAEGAAIIDVGGESTRPGATPVSVDEELERVIPVIEALSARLDVPVSIDTSKPEVMRAGVGAGAAMINDVRALRLPGALDAARDCAVPVCLMHMQGEPGSMQQAPAYADVVTEVLEFLYQRISECEAAGIPRDRLLLDPGFGFGKTLTHNLLLLAGLERLSEPGLPVLAGMSRKSMIAGVLGREDGERLSGSVAAAVLAASRGAHLLRVHDVQPTADALAIVRAVAEVAWGKYA